jgi:crotonobetainyl-CoA:carnitine CoA-transferase CaiB-like acyl-CoA transferase
VREAKHSGPLSGIRVADFSVHAAGPFAGLMLAELGAQVIKIESAARLDITRRPHAMYGKPPSSFEQVNANKLSITLNLKEPRAVELALDLVRISDLVLENFRPGVMDRLGLGFDRLQEVKEDILMVSVSSNGQTGPEKGYSGYAPMFAASGGLGHLTGYPDGPPVELRHAMDHTGGLMGAFSAVAALCGKAGQLRNEDSPEPAVGRSLHVDVSVRDVATAFIGPALLDFAMNTREQAPQGNRSGTAAPCGVYRCAGDEAWVSIAVTSEAEWQGLLRAMGDPEWAGESRFGDGYQRWLRREELESLLEGWTRRYTPWQVTEALQAEGVAAFPSLAANQLMADPHLAARDSFPEVAHPEKGRQRGVGPPWRFSETPARLDGWTPSLGEDNEAVFHGMLGVPMDELRGLQDAKVVW